MKIALLSDIHWGVRQENPVLLDYTIRFFRDKFFPYLQANGIKHIICAGDFMDRRKYVNFLIYKYIYTYFIEPIQKNDMQFHWILGNHDVYFKNTLNVNSMNLMFRREPNCHLYDGPTELTLDNVTFGLVPWINEENFTRVQEFLKTTTAEFLIAHLELAGYESAPGMPFASHKADTEEAKLDFSKFQKVFTGHYHYRQAKGNIQYLGTPVAFTWADYGDTKGFNIFDTQTKTAEFIACPDQPFTKVVVGDSPVEDSVLESCKGKFVKVVVEKGDPVLLKRTLEKIESVNPEKVSVFDSTLDKLLSDNTDVEAAGEEDNTLTLLHRCAKEGIPEHADEIIPLINSLWTEANSDRAI